MIDTHYIQSTYFGEFPIVNQQNSMMVWTPLDHGQTRVAFASGAQRYFGLLSVPGPLPMGFPLEVI